MNNKPMEKKEITIKIENAISVPTSSITSADQFHKRTFKNIGSYMKTIREEKNMNRRDAAELLHISYENLRDIENNKQFPNIRVALLFCSIFNVHRDSFLECLLEQHVDVLKSTFTKNVSHCLEELNEMIG